MRHEPGDPGDCAERFSAERACHCCIPGSCLGSAYGEAQLWSMASGRSWCWQGSLL
jgi:hypothetical protein